MGPELFLTIASLFFSYSEERSLATGGDDQESREVWTLAPLRVYEEEPSQRPQRSFLESQKVIEMARNSWYDAKKRRGRRQELKETTTRKRSDRCVQDQCSKNLLELRFAQNLKYPLEQLYWVPYQGLFFTCLFFLRLFSYFLILLAKYGRWKKWSTEIF